MTFRELTWLNPEKHPFSVLSGHLKSWLANVSPSLHWKLSRAPPWDAWGSRPSPCRSLRALHPRGRREGPRPYFCEGGHTSQCKRRPVRGWSPCHRPQPVLRATPCAVLPCCDCDQAAHPELWGRSPGCLGEKRGWTVAAGSVQWTRPLAGTWTHAVCNAKCGQHSTS